MPEVTRDQALETLTRAVQTQFPVDELLEIHNELFPNDPFTEEQARKDTGPVIQRLVDHIHSGLEVDQLVELWSLIFIRHRNVWYNEEDDLIHYNDEVDMVETDW